MINLKIKVMDIDTDHAVHLTLPCNINSYLDKNHEYEIMDWDETEFVGGFDDIFELNDTLHKITTQNPDMTTEHLDIIYNQSPVRSVTDEKFIKKVCDNDFMLEEIDTGGFSDYAEIIPTSTIADCEYTAEYLALDLEIPFAKNITEEHIKYMQQYPELIDWYSVWIHYEHMGFECVRDASDKLWVFHWGE